MKIRNISIKDKSDVMKLVRGLYGRSHPKGVRGFEKSYNKFIPDTFLAEVDGNIVAYISIDRHEKGEWRTGG